MRTRMKGVHALRLLNAHARAGKIDIPKFLERHFVPEGGNQHHPIRFESWQKGHILAPVFDKIDGRRRWDTFLIGLPKKNGKSTLAACTATYALLLDDPCPEVYSAAGDKDQARIIFNYTRKAFERSPGLRPLVKFYSDTIERIDGNGFYRVLASDSSGTHGLNPSCVIWDELWNQPNYGLWEALVHSPARKDPFHFIVTYAGYQARSGNLLWDVYSRGLRQDDPRLYMFWRSGPEANLASWITQEYLDLQRKRFPDHIFRRLFLNEWSAAESTRVFRPSEECWKGAFEDFAVVEKYPGNPYAAGIDLANSHDFTAWAIIRRDVEPFRVVDIGKLPHVDYSTQVKLLGATLERFGNPKALVDGSGPGTAVIETMRAQGLNVEEFKFTNESKARIVTDLAIGFEQRKLILPGSGRTLDESRAIQELEAEMSNFEPKVLDSGNLRYGGSAGYHDDLVTALCLAYANAKRVVPQPWAEFIEPDPVRAFGDPRERHFRWHKL